MKFSELEPVTKTYTKFELEKDDSTETIAKNMDKLMNFGHVFKVLKTEENNGDITFKIIYYENEAVVHFDSFETRILAYKLLNTSIIVNDYQNMKSSIIVPDGITGRGNKYPYISENGIKKILIPIEGEITEIK